jgi:predicted AlkP superfamily phosphohydrolase/phosphomutase
MVDKKIPPHRVMVIGLDCGTFDLIKPWAAAGHLPNLARLLESGSHGILESTIPTISPAAWTSFMTGKNPGKHGVYDFFQRKEDSYDVFIVRNNLTALGTIFHRLSKAGYRVGVFNVPMTYPPEPVNGFMVSGLGAPDNHQYTYPPELVNKLKAQNYTINNPAFQPESAEEFLDKLIENTEIRAQAMLELLRQEPWDFFMVVFRDIDTIEAFYWHYMDPAHPLHDPNTSDRLRNAILEYHKQIDAIIGEMLNAFGEGVVFVMSDHGGGPLHKEVYVNNWLAQEGFLTFRHRKSLKSSLLSLLRMVGLTKETITSAIGWPAVDWLKSRLPLQARTWVPWENPNLTEMVDWSRTQAYSFGHIGQIFINLQGREPQGIVAPGADYERVVAEIVQRLQGLVDPETGEHVVTATHLRDELYHGLYTNQGPDINVIFQDMRYLVHVGTEFAHSGIFGPPVHHETGTHRLDGMVIAQGRPIRTGQKNSRPSQIVDLAPTIYYLMGLPIPSDVDGEIMRELLTDSFLTDNEITQIDAVTHEAAPTPWTDGEEAQVAKHLRDLGYLS